ncbi:shikimate dehydrogenase [Gordonia otitidis]|mgnify:CR=1 FL=1|uniref:Shikimate dehydrogenase n=1 Tax=Gordonia otitidis (strain DSM 44809 / CCUG 52243 / JCM 12355 / NBRC 100426 / IFM 10032) TaxID=1108044 RepID=H5TNU8_GORO1|nr:shikimate dehydrogenase [Gordonia otitidis]GAB35156.1 shikimate dehydrogenase [Gordonia otitidis NBRC 100426]
MDLTPPPRGTPTGGTVGRKAAVLGSPVSHSRSPDLHLAAYRALGLDDWSYERIECDERRLPTLVRELTDEWVGLSVTMPGKRVALEVADERTDRAVLVGSANTLVRTESGWRADCTDIDGMTGALREIGVSTSERPRAVVIGAGGTALPSVAALADAGITDLTVVARDETRARDVVDLAQRLDLGVSLLPFASSGQLADTCAEAGVVVSTVPAAAAAPIVDAVAEASALVDVIYDPWPTPLAEAVSARGGRVVGGLVMLLNQAYSQVEQFTGLPTPRDAMARALS